MFILLNKCFGGFGLSEEFLNKYPEYKSKRNEWDETPFRINEEFINKIREFGIDKAGGTSSNLSIVSIPNDITDWRKREDDGYEYIEYVKDGKIFDA